MKISLKIAAFFAACFVILCCATESFAQDTPPRGNYDDPFRAAADFAVKEAGKDGNAKFTLVEIEKAEMKTSPENLRFNLWLELTVKEEGKEETKKYSAAVVDRDQNTMKYSLVCWILSKQSLKP